MPRVSESVKSWQHRSSLTARTRDKHAQARDAITDLRNEVEARLDDIADSLHLQRDTVQGYFYGQRIKRRQDGVSPWNAARHSVASEWRAQGRAFRAVGDTSFNEAVKDRVVVYNTDPILLAEAKEAVVISRELAANQVRLPGKSRLRDTTHMQDLLRDQARDFNTRTGGHICGFIFRGHRDDYATPEYFGSAICREWFEQVLGLPIMDLGLDLESWALSGGAQGAAEKTQSRANVYKHEIRLMLDAKLKRATKGERTSMAYKAFGREVEDKYNITLHGWPLDALVNPSDIRNVPQLAKVHDALKSGKCFFRSMTASERERRAQVRADEELALEAARQRAVDDTSPTSMPAAKGRRQRVLPPGPVLHEVATTYSDPSATTPCVDLTGKRPNCELSQPGSQARPSKRPRLGNLDVNVPLASAAQATARTEARFQDPSSYESVQEATPSVTSPRPMASCRPLLLPNSMHDASALTWLSVLGQAETNVNSRTGALAHDT